MHKRNALKTIATSALLTGAFGLFCLLGACSQDKPQFHAVDITGAEYARDFDLPDQTGRQRTLADFKGKAVVLFFGYTQCPDVCPTTMSELAEAKRLLGPEGARVQGLFITLDPERDTPQILKAYMAGFDPGFIALVPTLAQLPDLAKAFKIYYKKVEGKTPENYTLDHTAGTYLYDPQGRLRLFMRYGTGVQALADDLHLLLKQ